MVHHYWARFLLALNKVKDCREENMVSLFCKNYTGEGLLNAISRRKIIHFADLATTVHKYYAMESAWKTQTKFGIVPLSPRPLSEPNGRTLVGRPIQSPRN